MMKAYEVTEDSEGNSCIEFATSSVAARREGANQLDTEFSQVSCKRAPWADSYAPGPVPLQVRIEVGGWWAECSCCCGRKIGIGDDYSDDAVANPENPVYVGNGRVYWNQACKDAYDLEVAAREQRKVQDQQDAEAKTLEAWPFATDIVGYRAYGQANGKGVYDVLHASFKFPGSEGCAHWQVGGDKVRIALGDTEAWDAVAATVEGQA